MKTVKNIAIATFFSFFIAGYSFASTNSGGLTYRDCYEIVQEFSALNADYKLCRLSIEYGWGQEGMHLWCAMIGEQLINLQSYEPQCREIMNNQ